MRWADERYVRLYTRDTTTWKMLPWQAKALLPLLLRKLDRAGLMDVGEDSGEAIAALTDMPLEVVEAALPALLKRDTFQLNEGQLLMPNFIEAQETRSSDAQRKRDQREKDRDLLRISIPNGRPAGLDIIAQMEREEMSQNVTESHQPPSFPDKTSPAVTYGVTSGHHESPRVTPSRAVPNLAVPSRAEPPKPSRPEEAGGLSERLAQVFQEERATAFVWSSLEEDALRPLLRHPEAEILKRWRTALGTDYPRCSSIRELVKNWNAYGGERKTPPQRGTDSRKAPIRAEDQKHGPVGEVDL